jgi:hypothetical protein
LSQHVEIGEVLRATGRASLLVGHAREPRPLPVDDGLGGGAEATRRALTSTKTSVAPSRATMSNSPPRVRKRLARIA